MAKNDEWHSVSIRKPTAVPSGALSFEADCFRLGSWAPGGPEWRYEIPFSEIVQVEYKMLRDFMSGRLKDGTEFEFRFKKTPNPAKAARQGLAITAALEKIPVGITDGGSLRRVGTAGAASRVDPPTSSRPCATPGCSNDRVHGNFCATHSSLAAADPGCLGCAGSVVVATMPVLAILAIII